MLDIWLKITEYLSFDHVLRIAHLNRHCRLLTKQHLTKAHISRLLRTLTAIQAQAVKNEAQRITANGRHDVVRTANRQVWTVLRDFTSLGARARLPSRVRAIRNYPDFLLSAIADPFTDRLVYDRFAVDWIVRNFGTGQQQRQWVAWAFPRELSLDQQSDWQEAMKYFSVHVRLLRCTICRRKTQNALMEKGRVCQYCSKCLT